MAIEFDRVQKPLPQFRKSLRQLPGSPAPDAVHKLRTRARQVEAIAAALPPATEKLARRLFKSIRAVRKAAGRVRDMDVLAANTRMLPQELHGESIARLLAHLESSRENHVEDLRATIDRHHKQAREHLKQYAGQIEKRNSSAVLADETEQLVRAAAAHHTAGLGSWPALTPRNLHAFRLKVKELRSVLQLLAGADRSFIDDLGSAKDKIGEWHDWLQLAKTAAEALDAQQHRAFLTLIRQNGKQKLNEALAVANAFRERHLELERLAKKPPVSERRIPTSTVTERRTPAA
jgi:CHAD domain-containing protein